MLKESLDDEVVCDTCVGLQEKMGLPTMLP